MLILTHPALLVADRLGAQRRQQKPNPVFSKRHNQTQSALLRELTAPPRVHARQRSSEKSLRDFGPAGWRLEGFAQARYLPSRTATCKSKRRPLAAVMLCAQSTDPEGFPSTDLTSQRLPAVHTLHLSD